MEAPSLPGSPQSAGQGSAGCQEIADINRLIQWWALHAPMPPTRQSVIEVIKDFLHGFEAHFTGGNSQLVLKAWLKACGW